MTILIIRISALGDVAMTVPAIYSFAIQYPDLRIRVLTHRNFKAIFSECPSNISIIAYNKERHHGIRGFIRLLKLIKAENIDVVADFHNVFRSWLIDLFCILKGCKVCMLRKERMKRRYITREKKKQEVCRPFTLRYFDVLKRLGFHTESIFTPIPHKSCSYCEEEMHKVGIAPFARYKNKTYPLNLMQQVINTLTSTGYTKVYLFGSKGAEQAVLEEWAKEYAHTTCVAGQMPIEEEIALMSKLDVMLTMDSANMHLASLVGTPVVSVWGSTTPECGFLGWGQKRENCIVAGLQCQPCTISGSNRCKYGDYRCLTNIPPQRICEHINCILTSQSQPK
ncbi:MAG: glycosyltransferase family 9 protein [Prevotellaceae bacterium]|nr:glycosyltransferase family 9 protein [Prevotellaceae bacterium]